MSYPNLQRSEWQKPPKGPLQTLSVINQMAILIQVMHIGAKTSSIN